MNKVYILECLELFSTEIIGVYKTYELAKKEIKKRTNDYRNEFDFIITEFTINCEENENG